MDIFQRNIVTLLLLSGLALVTIKCASIPEQIQSDKILNGPQLAQLRPLEKEIVNTSYEVRDQQNREVEFQLAYENEKKDYDNLSGDERKSRKDFLEKAWLKYQMEKEKRILTQLRLRERISLLELKKAQMVSLESKEPVEVAKYERYHRKMEDDISFQNRKIRSIEESYARIQPGGESK